jgi:hypothetical protein
MDASALARELDNLEKSWSGLDWWLNVWTFVVVIGVAVELIVLIVEYVHDWRDFKRATIRSPEKPSWLVYGLGFLGAALVAIGVAGEFRVHIRAGKFESDMRDKTRQLVALVNQEASRAGERASTAEATNRTLQEQLKTEGDKARSREAQLRAQNLATQHELEVEHQSHLELERRVQWRQITSEDADKITSLVRPFAGTHFDLSANMSDPEGIWYALQLRSVLAKAGWIPPSSFGVNQGVFTPYPPVGVSITIGPSALYGPAKALSYALHEIGVDAPWSTKPNQSNDVVEILVGVKPIPELLKLLNGSKQQ